MSSIPNRRSTLETAVLARFESTISGFIDDLLSQGITGFGRLKRYPGPARHFLVWLHLNGIELETVDGSVIDQFLLHDCECRAAVPARVQVSPWRKRRTSPYVMRFVRFLERTGRIETPGELDDNLRILDSFLNGLRGDGYARTSIDCHYAVCAGLIVWLHLSRIRLRDVKPDVYTSFRTGGSSVRYLGFSVANACTRPGVLSKKRCASFSTISPISVKSDALTDLQRTKRYLYSLGTSPVGSNAIAASPRRLSATISNGSQRCCQSSERIRGLMTPPWSAGRCGNR